MSVNNEGRWYQYAASGPIAFQTIDIGAAIAKTPSLRPNSNHHIRFSATRNRSNTKGPHI